MSNHRKSSGSDPDSGTESDGWQPKRTPEVDALSTHPELASLQQFIENLDAVWPMEGRKEAAAALVPSPDASATPARFGRFELQELLGTGGFGIVFRAFDPMLGREIALKLPRVEVWSSVELRERFLREGQAAAALSHPHILPVHEAGLEGGVGYIVSMYCPGPTLAQWIAAGSGACSPNTAAAIVMDLSRAVHHAHERGILHRDIKPSNVLLDPLSADTNKFGYVPRLTDFGLAKQLNVTTKDTATNIQVGTPRYMAPEQLGRGHAKDVGVFTDVYALGVVLYELLTGNVPFDHPAPLELARAIQEAEPTSVRIGRKNVSRDLETVCLKCLEKEPPARYRSAAELADDLQRFLAGDDVLARQSGWGRKWLRRCRRHKLITGLSAAIVLTGTVGIVGVLHQWKSTNRYATAVEQSLVEAEQGFANMAWVLQEMDLWAESTDSFLQGIREQSLTHYRKMLERPAPPRPSIPYQATTESFRARVAELTNQDDEAGQRFGRAIELWNDLVRQDPQNESYRQALVVNLFSYGAHLRRYGHFDHPLAAWKEPLSLYRYLITLDGGDVALVSEYVDFLIERGKSLMRSDLTREAHDCFKLAHALAEQVQQQAPGTTDGDRRFGRALLYLGCSHRRLGGRDEAIYYFTQTNQLLDRLMATESVIADDDWLLRAEASRLQAACMRDGHHPKDAITMFEGAQHCLLKLTAGTAETPSVWNSLASVRENLAELYQSQGDATSARLNWEQFCETTQKSLDLGCAYSRMAQKLPIVLVQLGKDLQQAGDPAAAALRFEQACDAFERVDTLARASTKRRKAWVDCLSRRADIAANTNDRKRAIEFHERAIEVLQPAVEKKDAPLDLVALMATQRESVKRLTDNVDEPASDTSPAVPAHDGQKN